ncbi:MAG: hypothetical protein JRG91_03280 [Deltaproteobacteria bacterium]|nr:hypothetical protein [Deltaproteobacteria bacterium]
MRNHVHAFTCDACGGTLTGDDHEAAVRCPWCGVDNCIVGEDLPLSLYIEPVVTSASAVRAVRSATSAGTVTTGFSLDVRIDRKDLIFLPFNAIRAVRTGRMIVRQDRRRPVRAEVQPSFQLRMGSGLDGVFGRPGGGGVLETDGALPPIDDTKIILTEILLSEPACDAVDLGASSVSFERNAFGSEGMPLLPYSREKVARLGSVLEPERHPRELRRRLDEAGGVGEGRRIETVGAQLFQVYYPVWVVRGTYAGRSHGFVVDAVDGTLLAGRVPASRKHQALVSTAALLLAVCPLTLVVRGAAWWASPEGAAGLTSGGIFGWSVVLTVILLALGWGLMTMGWLTGTLLRSRELVFRSGLLAEDVVSLPARGPVERLGERILLTVERAFSLGVKAARHG